jgi:AhpD family alkylhydroperoxidase
VSAPRITPGSRAEVGVIGWVVSVVSGRVAGSGPPNLFLTLGRHRKLFRGWLRFAGRLMPGGTLPRRETELLILRTAHVRGCTYEFEHHVRLGRRAGVTASDVERVIAGPSAEGWSDRERVLLTAADELLRDRDLSDASWATLRGELSEKKCIELCLLVGHYDMLAMTVTALRIQPDPPR